MAAALLVALYAGLVVAYAIGGSSTVAQAPVAVPDGGVEVVLTARDISAAAPDLEVDVSLVLPDSLADDAGVPIQPITLTLEPTADDADLTYGTDRRPPVRQVKIPFIGDIEEWPFDSYDNAITAFVTVGKGADASVVPTVVTVDGQVQGWQLAASPDAVVPDLVCRPDLSPFAGHRAVRVVAGRRADPAADHHLGGRLEAVSRGPVVRGRVPRLDRGHAVRHDPDP